MECSAPLAARYLRRVRRCGPGSTIGSMQLSKEPMPHLETPVRAFERSRPARLALPDAPRQKLRPGLPLEVADSTATLKKPIKLLLANHHPVVRWGLRSCLTEHARVKVVGEAADGVEALRRARELAPDVVAMDVDQIGRASCRER